MSVEFDRVCIVGAGLMGISAARALKKTNPTTWVCAIDGRLDASPAQSARLTRRYRNLRERGWIDRFDAKLTRGLEGAEILLLAVPLSQYSFYFDQFRPSGRLTITDAGSVKACVLDFARRSWGRLPAQLIPAHPMAGSELSGWEASNENLYRDCSVILTPHRDTDSGAIGRAEDFWLRLGARTLTRLDAAEHDSLLGFSSHLPHLLSYALMNVVARKKMHPRHSSVLGKSFYEQCRLSASHPQMWADICRYNQAAVVQALDAVVEQLTRFRRSIDDNDPEDLRSEFERANIHYQEYRDRISPNEPTAPNRDSPNEPTAPNRDE